MEVSASSTEETKKLAQQLASNIKPGDILALYGDLGSGKTTFTRFLVEVLGFDNRVQSPTFVIMRHYAKNAAVEDVNRETAKPSSIQLINHIDLYRLTSKEEVSDLGIHELLENKNAITIIEWPELLDLPEDAIRIYFEYVDENTRKIKINE